MSVDEQEGVNQERDIDSACALPLAPIIESPFISSSLVDPWRSVPTSEEGDASSAPVPPNTP